MGVGGNVKCSAVKCCFRGPITCHLARCGPKTLQCTPHTARVRQESFFIPVTGKFWARDLNVWAEVCQFHNNEEVEMAVRKMLSHLNRDGILHSCRERQML